MPPASIRYLRALSHTTRPLYMRWQKRRCRSRFRLPHTWYIRRFLAGNAEMRDAKCGVTRRGVGVYRGCTEFCGKIGEFLKIQKYNDLFGWSFVKRACGPAALCPLCVRNSQRVASGENEPSRSRRVVQVMILTIERDHYNVYAVDK